MNFKLKRSIRTERSEEIAIFDMDARDEGGEAANIGKLHLHYLDDQIVGTLLIWQEYATGFSRVHQGDPDMTMDGVIDEILTEVSEPLGLPSDYGIEVYFPAVSNHQFVSNYADDDEEDGNAAEDITDYADDEEPALEEEPHREDEFARRLRNS